MDEVLVDYLNSGCACLLVGSGPSIHMGYPSWQNLATKTYNYLCSLARTAPATRAAESFLRKRDFPAVFAVAEKTLVAEQLLSFLRSKMVPSSLDDKLYAFMTRWPIAVYLTTNYDDAILTHLSKVGEPYIPTAV